MENRVINATLSTQSLTFRPGGSPVSFEVTVINGSDQFAAFQLEVLAAGASRSSGSLWYRLSPEVAAAKPPGGITPFQIVIVDTPLPAFVGTINLTVRIFSPQLREERKLLVRLTIEPGLRSTLFSVELPVRRLQVYPLNPVDIPVRVRNLGQQQLDVVLRFAGFAPSWLIGSAERRLLVDPGTQAETSFQCQPPAALQAPSQDYPFIVEASSRDDPQVRTEGIVEVLPVGFVEFTATPQQQTIPSQGGWLPDWKSDSAAFPLLFKNASNLRQQVNVQLQGRDHRKCTYRVVPKDADLELGLTTNLTLEVKTKRPWVGLVKTLQLEARALLSDQRLGSTDPATQTLELRVLPVVPLWLLLALLAVLAALLALIIRPVAIAHTDVVNVVRFSSDNLSVVSGSDDCTIRHWRSDGLELKHIATLDTGEAVGCGSGNDTRPESNSPLKVNNNQPVWALQFDPIKNDRVAAGLKNSVIQLWNLATHEKEYELIVQEMVDSSDKVFDLVFTNDLRYLISGHGSGKVVVWERKQSVNEKFQSSPKRKDIELRYQAQALALSQDDRTLAIGGNNKNITLLDLTEPNSRQRRFSVKVPNRSFGQDDYVWSLDFAPNRSNLLATADSDGYITIFDLDQCQINNTPTQSNEPINQECVKVDQWQAGKSAVRSLAFTENGSKLVSAGDDGRVVVWPLTSESKLDRETAVNGREIYKSPNTINSIDVNKQGTIIVSGGKDCQDRDGIKNCQVNLRRLEK